MNAHSFKRHLSTVFIIVGAALLVDAAMTVLWQEPFSALYTHQQQQNLQSRFAKEKSKYFSVGKERFATLKDVDQQARQQEHLYRQHTQRGKPAAALRIRKLHANLIVIYGTRPTDLHKGPGFYDDLQLPGSGQTVAIAGHRTTYLAPFRELDKLHSGDEISVDVPYGSFVYEVKEKEIIKPTQTAVLRNRGSEWLILTTCDPPFSAKQRLVVSAKLRFIRDVKSLLQKQ